MQASYRKMLAMKLPLLLLGLALVSGCSGSDDGESSKSSLELTPVFFKGNYELSGKVTFSAPIAKGTGLQLILTEATSFRTGGLNMGNEIVNGRMASAGGTEVDWAVHAIEAGDYWVSVAADTSGNNTIGEGDLGGYYAGTVAQPLQFQSNATTITVTNASLANLDFGAGPVKCLAQWGSSCTSDTDCRGGSCAYPSSLRVTAASGSCSGGVCATPTSTCPDISGSAGTLQPSQCFGDP